MVSLAKLERSHFFSWHDGKSKEHSSESFAARQLAEGGSASPTRFAVAKDDANFAAEGADIRLRRRRVNSVPTR